MISRYVFSVTRIVRVTKSGSSWIACSREDCRRFPTPASHDLTGSASRNFHGLDAPDCLAPQLPTNEPF